jgi:hypothetical protein
VASFKRFLAIRGRETRKIRHTTALYSRWFRDCAVSGQSAPHLRIAGQVVWKLRVSVSGTPLTLRFPSCRCLRAAAGDVGRRKPQLSFRKHRDTRYMSISIEGLLA